MLEVAVDASAIRAEGAGMARYLLGILRAARSEPALAIRWRLLHPRPWELPSDLAPLGPSSPGWGPRRPSELWRALTCGRQARRAGADLLWCPTGRGPLGESPPIVLTVHDLLPLGTRGPSAQALYDRVVVGAALRRSLPRARHIIAVSQDTSLRLRQHRPQGLPTMSIIPQAADERFHRPPERAAEATLDGMGLAGRRLWLHVGQLSERKNLPRLIAAFAAVRGTLQPLPELVLAGPDGDAVAAVEGAIRTHRLEGSVHRTGWLDDDLLRALYARAEMVICPSLHEGFGRVALEAMTAGRPVLSSTRGALASLDQGALAVDSRHSPSLASGMRRLATDADLQRRLAKRGKQVGAAVTWRAAAEATVAAFETAAH